MISSEIIISTRVQAVTKVTGLRPQSVLTSAPDTVPHQPTSEQISN